MQLDFDFTDISVPSALEINTPPLSGFAVISYYRDGDWFVSGITITGYRGMTDEVSRSGVYVRKCVRVDPREHPLMYQALVDCLETPPWRERIEEEILHQLANEPVLPE